MKTIPVFASMLKINDVLPNLGKVVNLTPNIKSSTICVTTSDDSIFHITQFQFNKVLHRFQR